MVSLTAELLLLDLVLPNHCSATGTGEDELGLFSPQRMADISLLLVQSVFYVFMNESSYEKCLFTGHWFGGT